MSFKKTLVALVILGVVAIAFFVFEKPRRRQETLDKETAEKAAPRIEEVAGKMNALAERGQELGDPPDDLKKELSEKIQEPMRKFSGEMMRISRIEGAAETVMKALEAMAARAGSGEKERPDITSPLPHEASTTGARFMFTPTARSWSAASLASSRSRSAANVPIKEGCGSLVKPLLSLCTLPPSWSTDTR